jgi:hypothetical protein
MMCRYRRDARACMKREIMVLGAFRHTAIIRLLGYSEPPRVPDAAGPPSLDMCLVYELGAQLDLEKNLTNDTEAAALFWTDRVNVLCEVASALNYMHCHVAGTVFRCGFGCGFD